MVWRCHKLRSNCEDAAVLACIRQTLYFVLVGVHGRSWSRCQPRVGSIRTPRVQGQLFRHRLVPRGAPVARPWSRGSQWSGAIVSRALRLDQSCAGRRGQSRRFDWWATRTGRCRAIILSRRLENFGINMIFLSRRCRQSRASCMKRRASKAPAPRSSSGSSRAPLLGSDLLMVGIVTMAGTPAVRRARK